MYGIRSKGVLIKKTDDSGNEVDIWLTSDEIKDIAKEGKEMAFLEDLVISKNVTMYGIPLKVLNYKN